MFPDRVRQGHGFFKRHFRHGEESLLRRDPLLDYIRGVLILAVMVAHFGSGVFEHGQVKWPLFAVYVGIVMNEIGHFAAPGFFLLSGYINAKLYKPNLNIGKYFRRRFRSIGIPYIAVSLSYAAWRIVHDQFSLKVFLHSFFLFGVDAQLYFVPVIVQFYLLFPLLAALLKSTENNLRKARALFFATIVFHMLSGVLTYKQLLPYLHIRSSFIFWCPYFFCGMLLGFGYIRKGRIHNLKTLGIPLMIGAIALIYYATIITIRPFKLLEFAYSHTRPSLMAYNAVCVWLILLIILDRPKISSKTMNWLGLHSYIIFLWHQPVVRTLLKIAPVTYASPLYFYLPLIPVIVFASAILTAAGDVLWQIVRDGVRNFLIPAPSGISDQSPVAAKASGLPKTPAPGPVTARTRWRPRAR